MATTDVAETETGTGRSPRPEKVAVVEEVRDQLASSPATLLTEYRGLSVPELAELRARLREAGADYVVVKNTLARIAAREAGFQELEEFLTGPTALTYCGEDPVGPAKALRQFAQDHPELMVKGGILEGRVVDAETAGRLADLESREDLLSKLAGMMYAALANTASLLQAPLSKVARLVQALEDDRSAAGEVAETTSAEAETAEAPAEADTAEAPAEAETAEGPGEAETAEEPAEETVGEPSPVEAVTDTATEAVETVTEAAAEAVETVADAAGSAAEDTPAEAPVEAAAGTVAGVAETTKDVVEDAVETAADTVAGGGAGSTETEATAEQTTEQMTEDETERS